LHTNIVTNRFRSYLLTHVSHFFFAVAWQRLKRNEKRVSLEICGFQRFPSIPKHTWSGHYRENSQLRIIECIELIGTYWL
jgi:hypothetical protein